MFGKEEAIKLRKPNQDDIKALRELFEIVIPHTFVKEGLPSDHEDALEEIEIKETQLKDYLKGQDGSEYLIAELNGKIVGTIWYGPVGEHICHGSHGALSHLGEIGTVFVLPDKQGQGIGKILVNGMFRCLIEKGIWEAALDSGYTHAQKVWLHLLGDFDYVIKDKWGLGIDHMIWKINLKEMT